MSINPLKLTILILFSCILFSGQAAAGDDAGSDDANGATCVDGFAGPYPCDNIDLLAHLSLADMGAVDDTVLGNDHWGWTDPGSGRDFVLFGLTDATAFVEITDPANPIYLGSMPGRGGVSIWRDIKVYQNYAYVVADIPTTNGLQVFDLQQLLTVPNPPQSFIETTHLQTFGPGHNAWVSQDAGFLYVFRTDTCGDAVQMFDLADPANPADHGCFATDDTPLSDAECLIYQGPDADYQGRELCFLGSDDNMTVYDMSDKQNVIRLADFGYPGISRAHQGVLARGERYWLMTDVMDEHMLGHETRTHVVDMLDIDQPDYLGYYAHDSSARDHNAYLVGDILYETNWMSGLRVLDVSGLPNLDFPLVGTFDTMPDSDSIAMSGAWSNYPWWDANVVTVSDTENGLFILQTQFEQPTSVSLSQLDGGGFQPLALIAFLLTTLAALLWQRRHQRTKTLHES